MTTDPQVIDADPSLTVASKYEVTKAKIAEVTDLAKDITVKDHTDHTGMQQARQTRLLLRTMRVQVENRRKELKADALKYGKAVDAVAKELKGLIEPDEQRLADLESTAKREAERLAAIEAKEKAAELKRRCDLLSAIGVFRSSDEVAAMSPDDFDALHADEKAKYDQELAERKAEADRIAAEQERLAKVQREQAEKQAKLDRQQAEIDAKQRAIDEAEQLARQKLLLERVASLSAVGVSVTDEGLDALAVLGVDTFNTMLAGATSQHEHRQAEAAEFAAKQEAERLERERVAEENRKAEEARVIEEQKKAEAAKAPAREKLAKYSITIGLVALPTKLKKATRDQLIAARQSFLDELARIADKL